MNNPTTAAAADATPTNRRVKLQQPSPQPQRSSSAADSSNKRYRKLTIPRTRQQCRTYIQRLTFHCISTLFTIADKAMYLLGPILIAVAIVIISGLTYLYASVLLPMLAGTNWIYTIADANAYWYNGSIASSPIEDDSMPISYTASTLIALSTPSGILHTTIVTFFLINIIYNYYQCVITSNTGPKYNVIVREMACITDGSAGFTYPETEEELLQYKRNYERRMYDIIMMQQQRQHQRQQQHQPQQHSQMMTTTTTVVDGDEEAQSNQSTLLLMTSSSTTTATSPLPTSTPPTSLPPPSKHQLPVWQLLSPNEWGYCRYSNQPKPPRSHYDHVTKALVLNMDHYCPWMFNVVGYFNYRYFFNFLTFVTLALWYGTAVCYISFGYIGSVEYKKQIRTSATANNSHSSGSSSSGGSSNRMFVKHIQTNPYIPTPNERTPITLGFMLCICLGLAVFCLFIFHLYLILSAQSTIEFHGNWSKRRRSKKLTTGAGWTNPYSTGSWKKNWDMIYGSSSTTASSNSRGNYCRYYYNCWNIFIAMMPSNREPEYLPFPINRELIRRQQQQRNDRIQRNNNDNNTLLLADSGDGDVGNNNEDDGEVMETDIEMAASSQRIKY